MTPRICTTRQARLIAELLDGPKTRKQLGAVGALNIPHIVSELRRQHIPIDCERIEVRDRDGKRCHPGRYSIPPEHHNAARQAVVEFWRGDDGIDHNKSNDRKAGTGGAQ